MFLDFIKFEIWSWFKVKLIYWGRVIKYRGKKNIPPELIFQKLTENVESLSESIMNAVRASPEKMSAEERNQMREVVMKVNEFKQEIKNLKNK